jgi:hypothetical protein
LCPQALRWLSIPLFSATLAFSQGAKTSQDGNVLQTVVDIPMPGPAVRFDYQSLDATNGRLYIAHMNADQLVVFDTQKRQVIANLDGFKASAWRDCSAGDRSRMCIRDRRAIWSDFLSC